ncbi:MAG: antitoxin [Acidimicrobiia bacterium]
MAEEHGDKIEAGIDKAAEVADDKTGGKYTDKIESGSEKAKDLVEGVDEGGE